MPADRRGHVPYADEGQWALECSCHPGSNPFPRQPTAHCRRARAGQSLPEVITIVPRGTGNHAGWMLGCLAGASTIQTPRQAELEPISTHSTSGIDCVTSCTPWSSPSVKAVVLWITRRRGTRPACPSRYRRRLRVSTARMSVCDRKGLRRASASSVIASFASKSEACMDASRRCRAAFALPGWGTFFVKPYGSPTLPRRGPTGPHFARVPNMPGRHPGRSAGAAARRAGTGRVSIPKRSTGWRI